MTPANKPATPLPFVLDGHVLLTPTQRAEGVGMVADCDNQEIDGRACQKNAAYIAHAANAYPRLVAALRPLCAVQIDRATEVTMGRAFCDYIRECRALLRELGEAE